ncbi:MAG TPA: MoxR family ATPase, partial [Geobacteraceae bacterium]
SRLQPQIFIDFPEADEELLILKENLPFASSRILQYVVDFLQRAHTADELYSVRDGINIARYALKMMQATGQEAKSLVPLAVERILGDEALRYLK